MKNIPLLIALITFFTGILYYLLFREPTLLTTSIGIRSFSLGVNPLLGWFPSFVHQLSFILLSWLAVDRQYPWQILFTWLTINIVFEIGQGLDQVYFINFPHVLQLYFQRGTYSHSDILAICIATVVAYIIMNKYTKKELS
ncbi:MAG TPA: hypothetical protein EYG85_09805 [Crocinitomix sp.]|nr:hypothetical protein [Crocinitomix sp.]